jgi:hypothetical protein
MTNFHSRADTRPAAPPPPLFSGCEPAAGPFETAKPSGPVYRRANLSGFFRICDSFVTVSTLFEVDFPLLLY